MTRIITMDRGDYCFSKDHGHRSPTSLWWGDQQMAQIFRDLIRKSRGRDDAYLMAGESCLDFQTQWYSLSYIRLVGDHVPVARYADPRREIMIAVSGFNDRDMVNCALRFRYIMSIEPFYFKGNPSDASMTVSYANKVETLRAKYREFLWEGRIPRHGRCAGSWSTATTMTNLLSSLGPMASAP